MPEFNLDCDATIEQVLEHFDIKEWDLLLVGDGSGTHWGNGVGWGCVSIDRLTFQRQLWYGAANNGAINMAEAMAYMLPLLWFLAQPVLVTRMRQVHIITDSSYVATCGQKSSRPGQELSPVWDFYRQFQRNGVKLNWYWLKRDSITLNKFADELSRQSRVRLGGDGIPEQTEVITGLDYQQTNPFDGQTV